MIDAFLTKTKCKQKVIYWNAFHVCLRALFIQKNIDHNLPDIHDVFHIYLSKILYEAPDKVKDQCGVWGFDPKLIEILTYKQMNNLTQYEYACSTQVAVINHEESKTIIIAFRGTEPMHLVQWSSTDFSRNFKNTQVERSLRPDSDPDLVGIR